MARIRSVHPSLFTDEAWVSCSPLARILYVGLWTDADDQGLFEWKPLQIKMRLLPGDMAEAGALLDELAAVNLIRGYEVAGARFGAIRDFRKFQRPQKPNAIHPITEIIAEYVSLPPVAPEPVSDHSATGPVISPQMEDVGEGEEKKDQEPTVPCPAEPNVVILKDDFARAWKAYPAKGRERSKSQAKTLPIWRDAAKAAGGSARLADAVSRYVREDQTHKGECGPPAFDRWLRDGRWEHWLPDANAPNGGHTAMSPELQAQRRALLMEPAANA